MNSFIKVNDIWKEVQSLYIKVNDIWKEVKEQYIKVDNVWKQSYQSCLNVTEQPVGAQGIWCGYENFGVLTKATGTTSGLLVSSIDDIVEINWFDAISHCNNKNMFLPNISQLFLICSNRYSIGGFNHSHYWSSTQSSSTHARWINFMAECNENPANRKTRTDYNIRCALNY